MGKLGNSFNPNSLESLVAALRQAGCKQAFCKLLRPNDNSKQQIYLSTDFSKLPPFPLGVVESVAGKSGKPGGAGKNILRAKPHFSWLNQHGKPERAPETKFIFYPQYPEVRLSGFLFGCAAAPSQWMKPELRQQGRILVVGVTQNRDLVACLVAPNSTAAKALTALLKEKPERDLFLELSLERAKLVDSREALLAKLLAVHRLGWIAAQRLKSDGSRIPYRSSNSGGYTLEAECGVVPNGKSEPDYLGWELKQYKVTVCARFLVATRISVMTPEPDGGFYGQHGVEAFVRKYGYQNTSKTDRYDFTGRHDAEKINAKTKMVMTLPGYDSEKKRITEADGGIHLISKQDGEIAASWSFAKLSEHWQRKHNHAAYVPSLTQKEPKAHFYCPIVRLALGTTFGKYLDAVNDGHVVFDPGMKIESASTKPKVKARSQFRITANKIHHLYDQLEAVTLSDE